MNPIDQWMVSPAPTVSSALASQLAADLYGVTATAHLQIAERDRNFRMDLPDGGHCLLKVHNCATGKSLIDFQNRSLLRIAAVDPELPVPRIIRTLDDKVMGSWQGEDGQSCIVRMLSWVPGEPVLFDQITAGQRADCGRFLARLGLALEEEDPSGSPTDLPWDLRNTGALAGIIPSIQNPGFRASAETAMERFVNRWQPEMSQLREYVIHNDFNPDNVLVQKAPDWRISGVIDFGDMVSAPPVCDLAVAGSYQLTSGPDPVGDMLPMVRGFCAVRPLDIEQAGLLLGLVQCRLLASLLIQQHRQAIHPENAEYFENGSPTYGLKLESLMAQDQDQATARLREAMSGGVA